MQSYPQRYGRSIFDGLFGFFVIFTAPWLGRDVSKPIVVALLLTGVGMTLISASIAFVSAHVVDDTKAIRIGNSINRGLYVLVALEFALWGITAHST